MSAAFPRPPVEIEKRRAMTPARKRRIWEREGGICWMCTSPVDQSGPGVVYDHRGVKEIDGSDADEGIFPIHADPCNKIKTAADLTRIGKTRRQAKMGDPKPPSTLKSRGFEKPKDGYRWPKRKMGR